MFRLPQFHSASGGQPRIHMGTVIVQVVAEIEL